MVIIMAGYLAWGKVPSYLSDTFSKALGTSVYVGNANLSLQKITLNKISIDGPKNSKLPKAFECQELQINAWLSRYLQNPIEIDLIELNDVYLGLEFDSVNSSTGNWSRLMGHLEASQNAHAGQKTRSVLIKKLVINRIECQVLYDDRKEKVITLKPIDQLVFENISSSEGFPVEQLMNSVLGKMLKEVFVRENIKDMLNKLLAPQDQLQGLLKPFKLF